MVCVKLVSSICFSGIVDKVYEKKKWIASNDANTVKVEFDAFLKSVLLKCEKDFLTYDVCNKVIDHFIGSYKHGIERFKDSWVTAMALKAYNHLVSKHTLNHLAKLVKWFSCIMSSYLYVASDCGILACHIHV